jgi:K+-transporting ATPase ATPase C chain
MRLPTWLRHLAALRALLALTALCGVIYPLLVTGIVQLLGLRPKADGSLITTSEGQPVGSRHIGQSFTDAKGAALSQYFQSRPSAAGDGYDPTSTGASNLGPEDIVDTLPNPGLVKAGKTDPNVTQSLLTQVCARSKAVGELERVSGARPFCPPGGVGAVLAVFGSHTATNNTAGRVTRVVSVNEECPTRPFLATYHGVRVQCAQYGADYSAGELVPIRGDAPADPVVPADAVTPSGSGLDPGISLAYAAAGAADRSSAGDTVGAGAHARGEAHDRAGP